MSLRSFHVLFISVCILFCIGFGVWLVLEYRHSPEESTRAMGVLSALGALGLVIYLQWFLKKYKTASFLSVFLLLALSQNEAHACAVCFQDSDPKTTLGFILGTLFLIGITYLTLGGLINIIRRADRHSR